ncbi:carbamoyltransferase N-terminal domain-containing protein [Finegoldia magna]|uniref:carbamoyltransferase N-terminal domain-containing protein n=1 Tax=Finegoldia magna TaxID=1260 RepID=UPI00399B18DF
MAAINYCLEAEKIAIDDLDLIVIGRSMQLCINDVMKYIPIKDKSKIVELPIPSHHQAHAYSSYFASGFEKSLILIIDEQGHWLENNTFEKESIYIAENEEIKELQTFKGNYIDISIGMFYDLFSVILGFTDGSVPAAGKLMGLASYGKKEKTYKLLEVNKEGNINVKWDNLIQYLKLKSSTKRF